MAHRPTTLPPVGSYQRLERVGGGSTGTLFLASQGEGSGLWWLHEADAPPGWESENRQAQTFMEGGKHYLALPVAGSSIVTLAELTDWLEWKFIGPRWAGLTRQVGELHSRGKVYTSSGPLYLDNLVWDDNAQLHLSSLGQGQTVSPPLRAPEATATPASDVYVLGKGLLWLLGHEVAPAPGPTKPPALPPALGRVLAHATAADPSSRWSASALAEGLNTGLPKQTNEAERTPWLTGCLVPLLVVTLLAVGGFTGFRAIRRPPATPTPVLAAIPLSTRQPVGALEWSTFDLATLGDGRAEIVLAINENGAPLASDAPVQFNLVLNEAAGPAFATEPLGPGQFRLRFEAPSGYETVLRLTALVRGKPLTKTIYLFDIAQANQHYGDNPPPDPAAAPTDIGVPPVQTVVIVAPDGGDGSTGNLLSAEGRVAGTAGVGEIGEVVVQVDAKRRARVSLYFTLLNRERQAVRLGGNLEIEVLQDGAPVDDFTLTPVDPDADPLTVALVVDVSGSMEGDPIVAARAAATEFVSQLAGRDVACLYSFATQVTLVQPCTDAREQVVAAIAALQTVDDTSLYDAVLQAATDGSQREGRQAIVVLSDGADTSSQATLEGTLAGVQATNLPLHIIGLVSEQFNGTVLTQLTEGTQGIYLPAPSTDELRGLYDQIQAQLANQYKLSFTPNDPDRSESTITIRFRDGDQVFEVVETYHVE